MFYITTQACRRFTLAEILIMAAMNNLESSRYAYEGRARPKTSAEQRG